MASENLSIAEIEARYPAEWLLIDDPQTSATLNLEGGKVAWHSKDRDEVHRKAIELRLKKFAVLYTGSIPEGTALVL